MKKAACALIFNGSKLLAVSRRDNLIDLGLPGGGLEDGEDYQGAMAREIREETGLEVKSSRLVFERKCGEYMVATFLVDEYTGNPKRAENDADVLWVDPERLLTAECSFMEYNAALFAAVGITP
jgi:8-oxo-dGTP pyrophosphatase MutT (NUDIX family)